MTRPPDYEAWMVPSDSTRWKPRRVRVWNADPSPVRPLEWHSHLAVEGLPPYDPPRAVPGGSAIQATMLAFVHLNQLALEQDAIVVDTLPHPPP